ncbi:MAG: cobalamin-dependent protein [Deltaproteobacteria bacterium]|nr:cobalamin-dependent protein [Deltaproteobacteria bacterium]
MKVLLIATNTLTTPYPVYPLGLDHVADAIRADHDVKIADINALGDIKPLIGIIDSFAPDVVGMSLRNIDNTDQRDQRSFVAGYQGIARTVRNHTEATLVLGGSGFTLFPREMMNVLGADYGIVGEGERLADLLKAMEEKAPVTGIPGVVTREGSGKIPRPLAGPFGRKHLVKSPHLPYYLEHGGMLNLQTKRGCPFSCIYCTYPHIEGKKLRLIQPEAAARDALRLQDAGAKYFYITDSVFNSHTAHSMAVAEAFIAAGVKIPWGAFFAPMKPPEGYFELMARAGLTHAEFGTESLCDAVLKKYGKPFCATDVFKAHKAALDSGLYVSHFFLLGGPGESENSIGETLTGLIKLTRSVFFFFTALRIYPHTDLYDMAVAEGQISASTPLLEPRFYASQEIPPDGILARLGNHAKGRPNWVLGSGGESASRIVARLYERGHTGPLWEHLIR